MTDGHHGDRMEEIDERTPLLRNADVQPAALQAVTFELRNYAKLSIPASIGYTVQNSIQTVSIAIVSKSGSSDLDLSASAHAFMIAMVTAWIIALGGSTALDTLGSSAFSRSKALLQSEGASKRQRDANVQLGLLLQRSAFVLLLLYVPFAVLWCFCAPVLIKLGQPQDVAYCIQQFLRRLAWGAPGYILFETGKKFCIVQNSSAPTVVISIMAIVNVFLNIFFIRTLQWGMLGSPIAVSITYYLSVIVLAVYVKWSKTLGMAWGGLNLRKTIEFRPLLQVSKLVIPGVLMIGSEWIAFEIIALAAGNLGATALAAQSVIMTFDQVINTIPFGLGIVTSARMGNLIGEASLLEQPRLSVKRLRIAAQSATLFATLLGALIGLFLFLFRDSFGYLFSSQDDTVALVAKVLPLVATFQIFDGWVAANGGALRGVGKQKLGAVINLASYYLIALPLGLFLAFRKQFGLQGLWMGNTLALGLVGFSEWIFVTMLDWNKEIDKIRRQNMHM